MSTKIQRIAIFHDTMDWIKKDKALAASVENAKKHTEIFWEEDYPDFNVDLLYKTDIAVTKNRSYEAAMKLREAAPESKIAVMNLANAFHPGGSVKIGCNAQEECLCRTSTIYPVLNQKILRDTFYKHHHTLKYSMASDALIYTEGVVVCKTDEDIPKRLPQEEWLVVDVITVAAPDLSVSNDIFTYFTGKQTRMNDDELFDCHVKRAKHMLTCAAAKGADTLVLGALGCGVFLNNPEVVARAYKKALEEFPKVFKKVEFAVYCTPGNDENYQVFKRVFGEDIA